MMAYVLIVLGILYLIGLNVGLPLAICSIVTGICLIIKAICNVLDKKNNL